MQLVLSGGGGPERLTDVCMDGSRREVGFPRANRAKVRFGLDQAAQASDATRGSAIHSLPSWLFRSGRIAAAPGCVHRHHLADASLLGRLLSCVERVLLHWV